MVEHPGGDEVDTEARCDWIGRCVDSMPELVARNAAGAIEAGESRRDVLGGNSATLAVEEVGDDDGFEVVGGGQAARVAQVERFAVERAVGVDRLGVVDDGFGAGEDGGGEVDEGGGVGEGGAPGGFFGGDDPAGNPVLGRVFGVATAPDSGDVTIAEGEGAVGGVWPAVRNRGWAECDDTVRVRDGTVGVFIRGGLVQAGELEFWGGFAEVVGEEPCRVVGGCVVAVAGDGEEYFDRRPGRDAEAVTAR